MQIEIKIEMTAWDGKTHCFFDTTGFQLMGSYDAENLLFCTTRTRGNVEIFVAVVPTVFLEELFKKFVVIHQVEWFLRDVTPYQFSHCSAFCPDSSQGAVYFCRHCRRVVAPPMVSLYPGVFVMSAT